MGALFSLRIRPGKSVRVSPYLRSGGVNGSRSSPRFPLPARFTYPTDFERKRVDGNDEVPLVGFLSETRQSSVRFFSALGWGRRSRGIGERDNGVRGEKRGFLSRVVVARSTDEQRRRSYCRRRGSLPGKGSAATRQKKRGIVCREQRRGGGGRGHGGGGLGRAISIVGREHRSRSPI